ncbi:FecR domain-containing protein [Achromobacter sp. UMC46]|uniref:FecR family protein n=1 Tax=Achromobacter sp. UMC46 TaxID=1862319 RepID=UPI0016036F77|nr:FecR domain-containing protein [Achromobacter sp. UMC46]MBB1593216.1 iron dicitrate transport regulator FecR [Achromobacter sp. UMC46]
MRPASDAARAEAATWFARTRSGELDAAGQAGLQAWLAADPRHAYEYRVLESIWQAAADLPPDRLRTLAEPRRRARSSSRRQVLALSVTALAVGAGVLFWQRAQLPAVQTAEYRTAPGERRVVALPDGSSAELNSRTHMKVRFGADARQVELLEGEALFSVDKDARRPFVVDAGLGTATVTGTRFDVRRDADEVRVVVESGSVRVAGRQDDAASAVSVTPGLGARVTARGKVDAPQTAPVASALAWRAGQIVFSDTDLASAVREVSRYRAQPVVLGGGKGVADLRLTSVFRIDDTDAFLTALPHILPVTVRRLPDGRAEVVAR